MKNMKKIVSLFLSLLFAVQIVTPVNALDTSENRNIIYENEYITKFTKNENNHEYTIVFDRINDLYVVDNKVYSNEQLIAAYDGTDNLYTNLYNSDCLYYNNINYDELYEESKTYMLDTHPADHGNIPSTRCNFCGIGLTVPKSGYNSKGYIVTLKEYGGIGALAFSNTTTFAEALAAKLGITLAKATTIKLQLLTVGVTAGMMVLSGRTIRQFTHKTCPLAIKEQDLVQAGTSSKGIIYNVTDTRYFFNGKPY